LVDENGLARSQDSAGELATPKDVATFQDCFLRLLERRTQLYTMGDSTSVPKHVAVDMLRSVCFVLGIDPDDPVIPPELLTVDLEAEFRRRLADIERKVALAEKLWREAVATAPRIPNVALQDTLASIGNFPAAYDYRSMAHEIPVSFDYPLCHWVPESMQGVHYINEYLRRLLIENDFLDRFDTVAVTRVLAASSPDYVELLVNLYEQPATNTIALALLGMDPRPLVISDAERAGIAARLEPLGEGARKRALLEAARDACDALGISDTAARDYLLELAPELLPRIDVGIKQGDLRGVFVG
jgi:hypothetical protein